jgi:hypothetical protein
MFVIAPWMWGVGVVAAAGIGITAYEVTRPKTSSAPVAAKVRTWVPATSIPPGTPFAIAVPYPDLTAAAAQGVAASVAAGVQANAINAQIQSWQQAGLITSVGAAGSAPPANWTIPDNMGDNTLRAMGINLTSGPIPINSPTKGWILQ